MINQMIQQKKEKALQDKCPSCTCYYDTEDHTPMLLCKNLHLYCLSCHRKQQKYFVKCFVCQKRAVRDKITAFRSYINFFDKMEIQRTMRKRCQQQFAALESERTAKLKEQIMIKVSMGQQNVFGLIHHSKLLFKFNKHRQASQILQSIIEANPEKDYGEFFGLGSRQESICYYEHNAFQWFAKKYAERSISVYDLLGLCNLSHPNYSAQREWYERMVRLYPNNVKLIYGLAVTEHNAENFQYAINLYQQLIELNPTFSKPYQMLSFISQHKSQDSRALELAKQCLALQPTNIFASLISIKLDNNYSPSQKCQKLLEVYNQEKDYAKSILLVGYLSDSHESISYYQKCLQINPFALSPLLRIAERQAYKDTNYQKCLQVVNKAMGRDYINQAELSFCYRLKGFCYYKMGNWTKAIQIFNQYFSNKKYKKRIELSTKLAASYFKINQYIKSNDICKQSLPQNLDEIDSQCSQHRYFLFLIARNYYYLQQYQKAVQMGLFIIKMKAFQRFLICFIIASSYFSLQKYAQAQEWALVCLQNKCQQARVQIMRAQMLQIICKRTEALSLAVQCLQKYNLSNYEISRFQTVIKKCSLQLVRSKKAALMLKKQEKKELMSDCFDIDYN